MTLQEFLQTMELWHEPHKDGFLICVDDPYAEPETRDLDDEHAGYLRQEKDGVVILEMEDSDGYSGPYYLESVEEFARFWTDAIAHGFRELNWDSYAMVDMTQRIPPAIQEQAEKFEQEAAKAIAASCHSDFGCLYTESDDEIKLRDGGFSHDYCDEEGYEVCTVEYEVEITLRRVEIVTPG